MLDKFKQKNEQNKGIAKIIFKQIFFVVINRIPFLTKVTHYFYNIILAYVNLIRKKDFYFFSSVGIETATFCNRKCIYCPNNKYETPELYMSEETFKKAIERLLEIRFNGLIYYHNYNEPLLDSRLPDFIRYAKKNLPKCVHVVFTNGDLLTMELAKILIDSGVSFILVTIHDLNPEQMIAKLKPILVKYGDYVIYQYIHNKRLMDRAGAVEVKNRFLIKKCIWQTQSILIDYNGNLLLCCNDYFRENKFGNIMQNDLYTSWFEPTYKSLRSNLRKGKPGLNVCKRCLSTNGIHFK